MRKFVAGVTSGLILVVIAGASLVVGQRPERAAQRRTYDYDTGALMRVDTLDASGTVTESIWKYPDGSFLAESAFENGSGFEIYLTQVGNLRTLILYRDKEVSYSVHLGSDGLPKKVKRRTEGVLEELELEGKWSEVAGD